MAVWSKNSLFCFGHKEIQMSISVIIPFYNPGDDPILQDMLYRAIRSAYSNLKDVCSHEIIVVNDGSPSDPDLEPVKEITVKYIRRTHGMLGAARNTGMDNATGDIITFLDADDCYYPGSLAPCIRHMEQSGADLLGFGIKKTTNDNVLDKPSTGVPVFSNPTTGNDYMCTCNLYGSACRYLISASLLKNGNLRFMENSFIEDEEFTPRMVFLSQRYIDTSYPVYAYCVRSGSIITDQSQQNIEARTADTLKALSNLIRFRESHQSLPHHGLDRKINYLAMDHLRRTLRRKDWRSVIGAQEQALSSLGLFPLEDKGYSLPFTLYSKLSRSRTGLLLLHLVETLYK